MSLPTATPPSPDDGSNWINRAWKERGLLSPGASVRSAAELQELHASSFFVRRNRHRPPARGVAAPHTPSSTDGWAARRHRYSKAKAAAPLALSPPILAWSGSFRSQIQINVKARLPQGVAAVSEPAASHSERDAHWLQQPTSSVPSARREPPSGASPHASDGAAAEAAEAGARAEVYLNLYDLCSCANVLTHRLGLGVYHSGIEVGRIEFTFDNLYNSGTGMVAHRPYHADETQLQQLPLRARLPLGRSALGGRECRTLLRGLAPFWPSHGYDLLEHNCHDWCAEAAAALGVAPPPRWVNRSARLLRFFSGTPIGPSGKMLPGPRGGSKCCAGARRASSPRRPRPLSELSAPDSPLFARCAGCDSDREPLLS